MDEEPDVYRIWMPEDNCPGLAMARAFGDFCLKDFGLISTPVVSYRKLTDNDEFVVLATDGVRIISPSAKLNLVLGTQTGHTNTSSKILLIHGLLLKWIDWLSN